MKTFHNKQTINISEYELPITVQKEHPEGYLAQCTIWDDCYAYGDTIEEAINEINAVTIALIDLYQEEGLSIPLHKRRDKKETLQSLSFNLPVIVTGT